MQAIKDNWLARYTIGWVSDVSGLALLITYVITNAGFWLAIIGFGLVAIGWFLMGSVILIWLIPKIMGKKKPRMKHSEKSDRDDRVRTFARVFGINPDHLTDETLDYVGQGLDRLEKLFAKEIPGFRRHLDERDKETDS